MRVCAPVRLSSSHPLTICVCGGAFGDLIRSGIDLLPLPPPVEMYSDFQYTTELLDDDNYLNKITTMQTHGVLQVRVPTN